MRTWKTNIVLKLLESCSSKSNHYSSVFCLHPMLDNRQNVFSGKYLFFIYIYRCFMLTVTTLMSEYFFGALHEHTVAIDHN